MATALPDFIQNPRRSLRAQVACTAFLTAAGGSCEARTEDVGAHGCRVLSPRLVRKGEPVQLVLGHALLGEHLQVNGRVVWTTDAAPWRLGIAFDEAAHAASARWFSRLLARGGFPTPQKVPERIPVSTIVYLSAPPRFVLDVTGEEMAVLREVGTGASVLELLGRFPDERALVERALFSLLAQHLLTLARGASVHPNAWQHVFPPQPRPARAPVAAARSAAPAPFVPAMLAPERWAQR